MTAMTLMTMDEWLPDEDDLIGNPRKPRPKQRSKEARQRIKTVILSYGMGVDSTAILLRWMLDPKSRDFPLKNLIVITAMVGNEFEDTGRLVKKYMLPLMRKHRVRFVQISRRGIRLPRGESRYVTWSDTSKPEELWILGGGIAGVGVDTLGAEMEQAGTVPQWRTGARQCSIKWKGEPLDDAIDDLTGGKPFRHVMGFNADELKRIERDDSYSTKIRASEYPLLEWGWGRQKCEDYIKDKLGVKWPKSCCTFCPFTGSKEGLDTHLRRWNHHPYQCAKSLMLERVSASLNPIQTLYPSKSKSADRGYKTGATDSAEGLAKANKHLVKDCWAEFGKLLRRHRWAVYRVQRAWKLDKKGRPMVKRSIEPVFTGSRAAAMRELGAIAKRKRRTVQEDGPYRRVWVKRRPKTGQGREELYAAAPALAPEKSTPGFAKWWSEVR
jgi:hypothetical protein